MEKIINMQNEKNYEKLIEPAKAIQEGKIVVFPTETVYGIGTNGLNEQAIKKIYEIKKRPLTKPISLLVSNIQMIEQVAENITELEYKIIKKFCPGPLTIILKKKKTLPDILTAKGDTVGIRIPANEIARKLIEYAGVPIATPSANISGEKSGTNIANIQKQFKKQVDYYIDGGKSKLGIGSTIVKIIDNKPVILRQGSITKEEIQKICKN